MSTNPIRIHRERPVFYVQQRREPLQLPLLLPLSQPSDWFLIRFRINNVVLRKFYKDDHLDEPPLTSYEETYHQCETAWLPKHWVFMSYDNGYHMATLLLHLDIPDHDLAVVLQKIVDVAVGIAREAKTSRMQQSIDVEITYTTTEFIVIQLPNSIPALPDSIPAIESSIDALENVNTIDSVEKEAFEDSVEKEAFDDSVEKCIICLEEYKIGDLATRMPCFHLYHRDCIARWLEDSQSCPVCRYTMPY